MAIKEIDMIVAESDTVEGVRLRMERAIPPGPLRLAHVEQCGPSRFRCRFELVNPEMIVGFRSVAELQSHLAHEFDIFSVERVAGPQRAMAS